MQSILTVNIPSVVPKLDSIPLPESALRAIVNELRARQDRFIIPRGYQGRTVNAVVFAFAGRYVKTAKLQSLASVIELLEWCRTNNFVALYHTIVRRVTDPSRTTITYIKDVLVPLIHNFVSGASSMGCWTNFLWPSAKLW